MYKTDESSELKTFLKLIPNPSSIAVVTNYRTGSTALCDYLSNYMNVQNFDEAFHNGSNVETYKNYQSAKYCVLKIMQDQIVEPYWTDIKDRFLLVGLYRKDLAAQAASWYISMRSKRYHTTVDNLPRDVYKVSAQINNIEDACQKIYDYNISYQKQRLLFDVEFAYEDIENDFNRKNTRYIRHDRPKNYDKILNICQNYFVVNSINYETKQN